MKGKFGVVGKIMAFRKKDVPLCTAQEVDASVRETTGGSSLGGERRGEGGQTGNYITFMWTRNVANEWPPTSSLHNLYCV